MAKTKIFSALILCALINISFVASIANGTKALDYPEAVLVNLCSGVILTPLVVLTAGHCHSKFYVISAPNAPGSPVCLTTNSTTSYNGNQMKSLDMTIIYLDKPIILNKYPSLISHELTYPTVVNDIGRTNNNWLSISLWISADVTIFSNGTSIGFPFNYQAKPDLSQSGDSGGPIVIHGTHNIVGLVDTDTIEHHMNINPPIDLFSRADLLRYEHIMTLAKEHTTFLGIHHWDTY
jgi:hypothetical protein